jgi:hemoglobin/transferrin/lactoferrin receptor protein
VDVIGYYQFNKNFSINAGVFNIFDRKYVLWSDVRGNTELDRLGQENPVIDSLTQPGRNASVSFKYQF